MEDGNSNVAGTGMVWTAVLASGGIRCLAGATHMGSNRPDGGGACTAHCGWVISF